MTKKMYKRIKVFFTFTNKKTVASERIVKTLSCSSASISTFARASFVRDKSPKGKGEKVELFLSSFGPGRGRSEVSLPAPSRVTWLIKNEFFFVSSNTRTLIGLKFQTVSLIGVHSIPFSPKVKTSLF